MNKVHSEIEYQKEDGTWVHSDTCPYECSSEYINDIDYKEYIHKVLEEWLNESRGTGQFYIKQEGFEGLGCE